MTSIALERRPEGTDPGAVERGRLPRLPRRFTAVSVLILLLALLLLAAQWREPQLRRLQIEGRFERVHPQAVRQAAMGRLSGGFFSVDIDAVRKDVAQLPWVARARVERVWPAGLRIRVWEREVFARWNGDALLDTGARAFKPAAGDLPESVLATLPRLGGRPGNEDLVMDSYRTLALGLANTPFAIAGLSLDARGEWTAQTHGGVELRLGQGRVQDRLPMILDALPTALGDRLNEVAYVDLRYTNGFAIGWREAAGAAGAASPPDQRRG